MYTESGIRLLDGCYDSTSEEEETKADSDSIRSVTSHFLQRERKLSDQCKNSRSNALYHPYKPSHLSSKSNQTPNRPLIPCSPETFELLRPTETTIHSHYTPETLTHTLHGHTSSVCSIEWNVHYPHLLLSASMDHTVRVWSIPVLNQSAHHTGFLSRVHTGGVRAAKWALSGTHYVSGGYDKQLVDVDVNAEAVVARISSIQSIRCIAVYPENHNLILTGQENQIVAYDLRAKDSEAIRTPSIYKNKFGQVHDLLFLPPVQNAAFGGYDSRFLSSASPGGRNSKVTLLVWDFRSYAVVYDRIDNEGFIFPSLRMHPSLKFLAAQSSLNQAVLFCSKPPYKRFKHKAFGRRQGGHLVAGYSIQSSFHPTGDIYASGDALGHIFYYRVRSGAFVGKIRVASNCPCLCAEYHPLLTKPSLIAAAMSNGFIHLYQ